MEPTRRRRRRDGPSRVEQAAQTRQRLLDAGAAVFVRRGIEAASVDEIAQEAGFTRGAFYWNFANKEDLLLAVLADYRDRMDQTLHGARTSITDPLELAASVPSALGGFPWPLLVMEAWLYGLHHPELRPALAELKQRARDAAAEFLGSLARTSGHQLPAPIELLSACAIALGDGLLMQSMLDPERVPESTYAEANVVIADALIALARQRSKPRRRPSG